MVFSSIIFLLFFLPITLVLYFLSPRVIKNTTLLVLSLFFYAWGETEYVLLMVISIVVNYALGLLIDRHREQWQSRLSLVASVVFNIGLLAYFKYAGFALDNINQLFSATTSDGSNIHLPIGISFFTFQVMSYVIDVYRGTTPVQRNVLNLGLFISFFPQLIAGPIVRYKDIHEQLTDRRVTIDGFAAGVRRFTIGLGKKVLIANNAAVAADAIFALEPSTIGTNLAWLGVIAYSLQIFFDFSGYSDMAIGMGMMFGFRLPENFNYPYISTSIREFWRRWHMTLSNWFRDYVYVPLGGNRKGTLRTYINLYIVFFLTGLWHGASWTFVIWGLIHGTFMVLERIGLEAVLERLWSPIQHVYMLLVVMFTWVFFRAESLDYALDYLWRMVNFSGDSLQNPLALYLNPELQLVIVLGVIFSIPVVQYIENRTADNRIIQDGVVPVLQFATTSVLLFVSLSYLASGSHNPFIYFRF
ncbi:MAG: MBOAT family protein [Chloroflexi bacterium]|nr:MBOAT family protein [Chloroflexota bacterium]